MNNTLYQRICAHLLNIKLLPVALCWNMSYNLSNKTCCWTCMSCSQSQYSDREKCMNCSEFEILNLNRDGCDRMRETYFQWNRREAIICLMFAIFGILLSVSTAAVFYKYGDTPIIKSSDKELSCTMFVGMIFLHMFVFVVLGKPTEIQCTLERIIPGVSLTIMYSALVVKTNRISRILSLSKRRFPKIKPKFLSLKFQVLVCSLFIISEAFICTMHLYIRPSHVERTPASSKDTVFLRCNEQLDGFMVDHLLNIVLLVLCTSYAFKTRNLPDNFNEAKFIGFSCYATSITWLAFVVVFHTSIYKLSSLCIALSMTALINLTFLFFPKMYIIFWKPQRNSREYFKTTNDIRCYIGSATVTHDYQLLMRNVIRGDFLSNTSITDRDINIKLQAYDARISVLNGSDNNNRTRTISCQTCPDDLH